MAPRFEKWVRLIVFAQAASSRDASCTNLVLNEEQRKRLLVRERG